MFTGQKIQEIPPETDGERNTQGRDEGKTKGSKGKPEAVTKELRADEVTSP